jgi:hypothetical protein
MSADLSTPQPPAENHVPISSRAHHHRLASRYLTSVFELERRLSSGVARPPPFGSLTKLMLSLRCGPKGNLSEAQINRARSESGLEMSAMID